jgi:hypothetical protein
MIGEACDTVPGDQHDSFESLALSSDPCHEITFLMRPVLRGYRPRCLCAQPIIRTKQPFSQALPRNAASSLTYMIVVQASSAANQTLRLDLRTEGKLVFHQLFLI